ncbi:E3 ubiquitin-protein ligase UPL6-like protein [Drosera capensis]
MFFSGDPSTRKRVDLGGRSSKERDRQKVLEQTRLERNRRLLQRQQNSAAIKIQKCFRGRRVMKAEHQKEREQFFMMYGTECQKVDRYCVGPDSEFLRQLLFFYNTRKAGDFFALVKTCQFLQQSVRDTGDIMSLFSGGDYSSRQGLVDYRVTQLSYTCILAVHANRNQLNELISVTSSWRSDSPLAILLRTANMLMDRTFPWSCKIVGYLTQRNTFPLMREIVLAWKGKKESQFPREELSILERVAILIVSHVVDTSCICHEVDPQWSFTSQILTIPFIWQIFPYVKEALGRQEVSKYYIHQMAHCMRNHSNFLPNDMTPDFPSFACLLGNVLEVASIALSQTETSFDMVVDFTAVATFLLELLPPLKFLSGQNKESTVMEDEEMIPADGYDIHFLNEDLQRQISNAIDPRFLLQLINVLFGGLVVADSDPDDKEVAAVSAACAFLHVTFNTLPLERVVTVLAYRTGLVPILWNFMRWCHENNKWSVLSEHSAYLPEGAPGWLLPLAVFCPVYKHMLMIVDNEEFYEREKPLSLKDIRFLIVILRQALWQLLWLNPSMPANLVKNNPEGTTDKILSLDLLQQRVSSGASELLSQLQDWNNRRQFAPASNFHADGVNDYFISQAMQESTRAREILKQAPFLVPFTSRVKIFTSQLAAARQRDGPHSAVFGRNRFRIRRDHILEDAFNQLNALSDEDLRGVMRVTFINEFGVEEAGIDGGGIFKDFMENITRSAFDIQYGLFKETADHLLYPNPGSGLVHEQHLQFFHFLGTILAKAMFEGILVDIPFATFFLSKLKQKYNYLNDLPSLDPELYRHLIFLKHYDRDISELELYFVIVNNEYGEQTEEELLPGGKHMRVTNENVITFIHLVANYRLNYQIRQQSSHFLRGFEQLIRKEWIDMFNEHELQMLISGSLEGLDIDDLGSHAQYSGGYHADHYVIEMFWEVIKGMSQENQKKFLKFVTGCSRGPLLGFKYLEPQFCIQRAAGSATEEALDRLPTAATCMNLLKLPPYLSKEQLERKLMYAISAEAGFDLS